MEKELNIKGLKRDVSLAEHTTFKIGGPACYFLETETKEALVEAVKAAKEAGVPFFILGEGSNVLVSDKGVRGFVIKNKTAKLLAKDHHCLYVESGVLMSDVVELCTKKGWGGAQWAAGIPGTVGGAVRGNVAAFEGSMADIIRSVEALDPKTMAIGEFKGTACAFGNKQSVFKQKGLVILSCVLSLKQGDKARIAKEVSENIDYRKKRHPLDFPSAGCIFKNPKDHSAGLLVAQCGLAGKRQGNAQISDKHSNFVINLGGARAEDVIILSNLMKKKVKEKFNIALEEEIQRVGF